jgi:glutaredoxin
MSIRPILYIKRDCAKCREAQGFLEQHNVFLDLRDIEKEENLRRLMEVSGQIRVPTFELDEFVVEDFSVDEFNEELDHNPEVKKMLGMAFDEE